MGFEPMTPALPWRCSTPELRRQTQSQSYLQTWAKSIWFIDDIL